MMTPSLPGWKYECVGDDIAWMKYDKEGHLRGINPEGGFFGVAPGTSNKTNPNALEAIQSNTIFTNVAETSDGRYYWEGIVKTLFKICLHTALYRGPVSLCASIVTHRCSSNCS